jgi:putative phosphoesterase
MRLAVVGDTHGKIDIITRELRLLKPHCLFFTGDHYQDGKKIAQQLKVTLFGVSGNCDHHTRGSMEKTVEIEGSRYLISHGHQYGVKSNLNRIFYRGQELGVNAVIFGHTHVACCERIEDMWLINPGSPSYPRLGQGSYVVISAENGSLNPAIIKIQN